MLTCSSCCVTVNFTRGSPTLGHLTNFCTNFYQFLISENSLKFAIFLLGNEFSIYDWSPDSIANRAHP